MPTWNPRPRGNRDLTDINRAAAADREQTRRMVQDIKIPRPAAGALDFREAFVYSGTATLATSSRLVFESWEVQVPNVPGDPYTAMSLTTEGEFFGPTEAGIYGLTVNASFDLGAVPTGDPDVVLNADANGIVWAAAWLQTHQEPRQQYLDCYYSIGPLYYAPGLKAYPLWSVELTAPGLGEGATGEARVWVTRLA